MGVASAVRGLTVSHPNSSPSLPTSSPLPLPSHDCWACCCRLLFLFLPCAVHSFIRSVHTVVFCPILVLCNTHPRPMQLPVRRDLSPASFSTTISLRFAAIDQQPFSPQTTQVAGLNYLRDFRFSHSISPKAINRLQASPTFPSWLTRKLPRYLTATPRATFFH